MATKQKDGGNISYSNILTGGMNKDVDPSFQPENTYTLAEGMTVSNREHDAMLETEEGNSSAFALPDNTIPRVTPLDPDANVIGSTTIDNLVFVFSTNPLGRDYITICNKTDGTSKLIRVNIDPTLPPDVVYNLGFDINFRVKAEAKILFNGDIGLYFTDNLNPIRYIRVKNNAGVYSGFLGKLLSGVSTPLIDVSMQDGGGAIACSSYLFAIGYTDASDTVVGYSTFTNPYPVVDDYLPGPGNIPVFDGAYNDVKANKIFELTINEAAFDPSYVSFKIALITFIGFSNTPSVFLLDVPYRARFIAGKMNIQITGNEPSTQISLAEVTIPFADYRYAKEVAQLYNRLLFANLRKEDLPIDFEAIANAISLTPWQKPIDTNIVEYNGTGGYKDGGTCVTNKSYMRDEVYSFAIVFIIDETTETNAYHIAAPKVSASPIIYGQKYPPASPGTFGTYYASQQQYKTGSPYFTGLEDDHVRYHVIPKYDLMQSGSDHVVMAIGVNVTNVANALLLIPDPLLRARITGYRLVRRQRNNDSNKTIVSQGLIQKYIQDLNWGGFSGNQTRCNTAFGYPENSSQFEIALNNAQIGFSSVTIEGRVILYQMSPGTLNANLRAKQICGFISPETVFGQSTSLQVSKIRPERAIGTPVINSYGYGLNIDGSWNYVTQGSTDNYNLGTNTEFTWYTPGVEVVNNLFAKIDKTVTIDQYWINPANSLLQPSTLMDQFGTQFGIGTVSLISLPVQTNHLGINLRQNPTDDINNRLLLYNGGWADSYVMNLENENPNCYTTLYSSEYISCELIPTIADAYILGGDTFISRFTAVNQIPKYVDDGASKTLGAWAGGVGTYIESQYNCDLRHRLTSNNGSQKATPYVDYISNDRFIDTFRNTFFKRYGIQDSTYNDAYSAENNFNIWLTKSEFFDQVFNFADRIIYSDQSIEGEGTDRYLIFRQNNYKDIPKNRGPIWNLFAYDNDIYAQCISSTYKTNMQTTAVISANNGVQATLGASGLFSMPEQELLTISGGYGGSQDSFSGVNTPRGRYFIDRAQGKVFLLSRGLEEVSIDGMFHFFADNSEFIVPNNKSYQENDQFQNPNGHGIGIGYDAAGRRLIICRRSNDDTSKDFTASFSFVTGKWAALHRYKPNMFINSGIELYTCVNTNVNGVSGILWKHRGGVPGSFYGQSPYPSILELSVNEPAIRNKVLDNLVVSGETRIVNNLGAELLLPIRAVGDFLKISSRFCNSGLRSLEYSNAFNFKPTPATSITPGSVAVGYYNRQYQLSCPRSLVQDSEYSNPNGINVNNIKPDMLFAPRLKDTYFIVRFEFSNLSSTKISIDAVLASLRLNIR